MLLFWGVFPQPLCLLGHSRRALLFLEALDHYVGVLVMALITLYDMEVSFSLLSVSPLVSKSSKV